MFSGTDRRNDPENHRVEGQDEEAYAEESEDLGRGYAQRPLGFQTQRVHRLQSQSEDSKEGGGEG